MKMMEKKEWLILNSIIYRIYAREDSTEMRREFLENLKMVIDFDSGDFFWRIRPVPCFRNLFSATAD